MGAEYSSIQSQVAVEGQGGPFGGLGIASPIKATVPVGQTIVVGFVEGIHRTTSVLRITMKPRPLGSVHLPERTPAGWGGKWKRTEPTSTDLIVHTGGPPAGELWLLLLPRGTRPPMGRGRDRQRPQWLRDQSQLAMEEGFRIEPR